MASMKEMLMSLATERQDIATEVPTETTSPCEKLSFDYQIATAVICALSFVFGIVFCFFGYRCFKAVLFLIGFIFGSILVYAICNEEGFLTPALNAGIAMGAGVLCGMITMLVQYVGLFMTGFHLGLFLASAILIALEQFWHPSNLWIPVGILFGTGLLFAVVTLQWQKTCTILATSLIGGAMITTSVDYYIEKFDMVQYVWDRFTAVNSSPVCWFSWIILAVWPLLFLFGVIIQFRITGKNYDHHEALSSNSLFNIITGCLPCTPTKKETVKTVVASPKRKRVELAKIRQREARETRHQRYRTVYKTRRFNGDVVSQAYLQSIQSQLSPEMKKIASKTHLAPTPPSISETQLQVQLTGCTSLTDTNAAAV
ncbi:transmembrane protein 198-like [Saccoglossus kowalevskii]|uniref:Transmembrane protein 198 n=1 Tax=Saccoglossus kowalevskii TaxID=10224 RepID=A0ABM0MGE8_SACKO|nr:PREDICTED: transmembrane protein 198-like isoform X2 [Saccoglossus kowalevskii]